MWDYYRAYFKARLIKTADLPADKNYIFCSHPHGVYALGYFANIAGNPDKFSSVFPGISLYGATLFVNFFIPLWREFLLSIGFVSAERRSLEHVLKPQALSKGKGTGRALLLILGAAEEYTLLEPGTLDLVLHKRKGFAKLALTTGSSLVPILTFGENDIVKRIDSPLARVAR